MMLWLRLAWASARARAMTLTLTALAVALAAAVVLFAQGLSEQVRTRYSAAVSGTDLIVGARGSPLQLLLYAAFRTGAASHNIRTSSVEAIAALPGVAWVVPISLGDSHRGYPVVGTSVDYFTHVRHGAQALAVERGAVFGDLYDAVIGAEVARSLGYTLGQRITLAHGTGSHAALVEHGDKPFVVSGILAATGGPADRSVHISLEAMQALHVDWVAGAPLPGHRISAEAARAMSLKPPSVTAAFVGLSSRAAVFGVQRQINAWGAEPLMAILPGVALDGLWALIEPAERVAATLMALLAAVALIMLVAVLWVGLQQRRAELAVLRACGVAPAQIALLLVLESALMTAVGLALGWLLQALAWALLVACAPMALAQALGFAPAHAWALGFTLGASQWATLAALATAGTLVGLIPAIGAARLSLADGLTPAH